MLRLAWGEKSNLTISIYQRQKACASFQVIMASWVNRHQLSYYIHYIQSPLVVLGVINMREYERTSRVKEGTKLSWITLCLLQANWKHSADLAVLVPCNLPCSLSFDYDHHIHPTDLINIFLSLVFLCTLVVSSHHSCAWFVSVNSLNSCWVLLQRWLHSSSWECDSWHIGELVPCVRSCEAERYDTSRVNLSALCSPRRGPSLDIHFITFTCFSLVSSNSSLCSFPGP